jgi:hypothetical protein
MNSAQALRQSRMIAPYRWPHSTSSSSGAAAAAEPVLHAVNPRTGGVSADQRRSPTAKGSAPTQHTIGNRREPTRNNGQTTDRQKPEVTGPFKIRTSAMTSGY